MSLRMIYGRSGSGKTRFCLNEIKTRANAERAYPLVLLVPEQFSFQTEKDLIQVVGAGGLLRTEVLSFRRLAFRVFNEAGGITYPHIHPAGKCMILYRILDKMQGTLKFFSKQAGRQGFVNSISTQITEFKRYNVTPEKLEDLCGNLDENNPLKEKLIEITSIYTLFERTLAERYRDSDDDLTLAAEKLSYTPLFEGAEIWIDGFNGFTPQEYHIIEQLIIKAKRVNVSLCTDCLMGDEVNDTFLPVKKAYRKLLKIAKETRVDIEPAICMNTDKIPRFYQSPEIAHLEKYLDAFPYRVYREKTHTLSLFSSVNSYTEIEACARDIMHLCRERNLRYRDIAVVTGNLPDYEKLIEVIFNEYEIPCFIDRKVDIINHPLVRMILSMLDIFNENWSYEAVFGYLKTGLTGIERSRIDELENYVLACGVRGSRWTYEQEWKMSPDLMPDEKSLQSQGDLLNRINLTRTRIITPLLEFRKKTKGRRKASDFCASLYDFLCCIQVPERIEKCIENFQKQGKLNLANEYSQVWNTVMEVFDQAVEVMGDETFGVERFSGILKMGFKEYRIGLIPPALDQVLIGNIERSKSHEIKALYILGTNDGVFPPSAAEEGILSDQDREELNASGIELASDTRTRTFDSRFMVYRTLTTAGEYLRMSWPIADHEGRTMRPSVIINRFRKLFPSITETSDIIPTGVLSEEMELVSGKTATFRLMVSALRQKADGKDISPIWPEVYRWFISHKEWKYKCMAVKDTFVRKNMPDYVSRDKIAALYGEPAISSVSRLERYTACPFAFFVQYGLEAGERKIYSLRPPDVGTFIHTVIETFSQIVSDGEVTWRSFDRIWCNEKVSGIVDEMLEKMQGTGVAASKRLKALTVRLKRVIARAIWLIAEHIRRSGFNPVEYEVGFGKNDKYPPITIELDSGERIMLTGRIDRVDALKTEEGTYLRIIDYKSGNKDFRLSDILYGLQIQLITYLDAIWENGNPGETPSVLPGGMLYFKVDDPIIKSNGKMNEEEVEEAIMKQLKMKGLLLADVKLIKEMDKTIEGHSKIIPAAINKGDVLGKNSSVATMEQFKLLRRYIRKLLKNVCVEMIKGNVSIKPYKKKSGTSCKYCNFMPVCQFDPVLKENTYNLLYDKENDEVWELMEREGNSHV